MTFRDGALALIVLVGLPAAGWASGQSPYAGEEAHAIKALDPARVAGLQAGAGLGYAKAAELNGYPGPAHLLELADRIPLSPDQVEAIGVIRDAMRSDAIGLGRALIEAEARLDAAFRERRLDQGAAGRDRLDLLTAAAGAAEARLRARHLAAHLEAARLLTPDQIAVYAALRGYAPTGAAGPGHGHAH